MKIGISISMFAGMALSAIAQVQVTETLGANKEPNAPKNAIFASSNAFAVKDYSVLTTTALQYWREINSRIDVFCGASVTTALGQKQAGVAGGALISVLRSKTVNVTAFNTLSAGLHRRQDAAPLWLAAAVASRDFKVRGFSFTGYSGYAATIPLGRDVADKLFTPPEVVHNIPIGVAIPKGKWLLFVEYDYGRKVQTGGVAVAYAFGK